MAPDINNAGNGTFSTSFARRQSLELMNPPADSPLRKTSFISGTFNLVATVVGGGVLSLPLVFAKAGLVLGTAMMVVAAIITDFSLYIVCCCVRRTGSTSYMDVVRFAFGPTAELLTTAILWIFLSGVLIAHNVLLKGIFGPLARDFVTTFTSIRIDRNFDAFVLFIILLLVSPLTLERNLYALRHICYVGFTSVCVIAVSIGVRVYQRNISRNHSEELHLSNTSAGLAGIDMQIKYFTTDWMDALSVFPIIILAFMCTFNVVEVHGALEDPTRKRVKNVIHSTIASCFVLFQAFGLAGYFYAHNTCKGNIFLNFDPSDPLIIIGRLGMGLTLMFGVPVITLPCREAFISLVYQVQRRWRKSREERTNNFTRSETDALTGSHTALLKSNGNSYASFAAAEIESRIAIDSSSTDSSLASDEIEMANDGVKKSEDYSIPPEQEVVQNHDTFVHVGATITIAANAFLCAVSVQRVEVVWSIIGSSLGMSIGFIIPCACYLKISGRKGMKRSTSVGALCLLIFSIVIAVVCTVQSF